MPSLTVLALLGYRVDVLSGSLRREAVAAVGRTIGAVLDRSPDYLPPEFIAWAEPHRDLLETVAAEFAATGDWPTVASLTRRFAQQGRAVAVGEVVWGMPKPLGWWDRSSDAFVLSPFGLRLTIAGAPLLDALWWVLSHAIARYKGADENPALSRSDIQQIASTAGVSWVALQHLVLERDAPFIGNTRAESTSDEWVRDVSPGVVRYWEARDADDYLGMRANELRQSPQGGWPSIHARPEPALGPEAGVDEPLDERDVFISHASEDKARVAGPIAEELSASGWSVWLDEYELTVGDSLNGQINHGLAHSRFGVVVLSKAFFEKKWTQAELAALAAKEMTSGAKVILPVWHGIDQNYLVEVAPVLADRLGVSTMKGIPSVVQELIRALARERRESNKPARAVPVVRSVEPLPSEEEEIPPVPTTVEERDQLLQTRPRMWEYLLFAGELYLGKQALEPLWYDHELRVGQGQRRFMDLQQASTHISRTMTSLRMTTHQLSRPLTPEIQQRAFGAPGEPGDPMRIQHVARAIIKGYEEFMRIAAELRNQVVPSEFERVYEIAAQFSDQPVEEIRSFIDRTVDTINGLRGRLREIEEANEPVRIELTLTLTLPDELSKALSDELERIAEDAESASS